jgi:hypothetical protein
MVRSDKIMMHGSETPAHDTEVTQMTTTEHTTSPVTIAEQLVGALAAVWRAIKARHAEVPEVVVLTVGSGTIGVKPGQARFGHFAAARWHRSSGSAACANVEPAETSADIAAKDRKIAEFAAKDLWSRPDSRLSGVGSSGPGYIRDLVSP